MNSRVAVAAKPGSKADLLRDLGSEYLPRAGAAIVHPTPGLFLAIEGSGPPPSPEFESAIQALYGTAWTIKMTLKANGHDFKVMPLEGFWWAPKRYAEDMFHAPPKTWRWKLVIRVPGFVGDSELRAAQAQLQAKGRAPRAAEVKLETIDEGECVQAMHVGPYATEPQTLEVMSSYATAHGRALLGKHHEVYLSDPNRTRPERLRTLLRHPVAPS